MKITIIINDNDAPYGSERAYNALRLADVLLTMEEDAEISVFRLEMQSFVQRKGKRHHRVITTSKRCYCGF